jgi:beta-barrel assembly-enhancing protease
MRARTLAFLIALAATAPFRGFGLDFGQVLQGAAQGAGIKPEDAQAIGQAAQAVAKSAEDITPEQEYYIGRAVAAKLLSTRKPYENKAANDYVNLVGRALANGSERPETFGGYHFLIIDSDEINAFAAPGGMVLLTRGLLRCAASEDAVAAILAHEIAHVAKSHGLKAIKKDRLTKAVIGVGAAAAQVLGPSELAEQTATFKDSIGDITGTLVNSGYSRDLELEADKVAVANMAVLGYDPKALSEMLQAMQSKLKAGGLDFAKTHPDPKKRVDAVEKELKGKKPPATPPEAAAARRARFKAALGSI